MTHDIDRLAPTRRPSRGSDGTQQWRDLLFLHWRLPTSVVRALVPTPLEVDTFDGEAYLGLVPFAMRSIRPSWWRWSRGFDFLETNLRTYVHYRGKPGVYFFSLDASFWLAVQAARWGWSLPYFYAAMNTVTADDRIHYHSHRLGRAKARLDVQYSIGELIGPSQGNTLEFFLLERYLLFVERKGQVRVGQVYHTPYVAHQAMVHRLEESITQAAGFAPPNRAPDCVHFSPGVDVEVFSLQDI